eukprot:g1741.t1
MAAASWRKDQQFIGTAVLRVFDGVAVKATVTGWLDADGKDPALWHVRHEDGDEEDLELGELLAARDLLAERGPKGTKRRRGARSAAGGAAAAPFISPDGSGQDQGDGKGDGKCEGEGQQQLSLYERMRLKNIARNEEAMRAFGLHVSSRVVSQSAAATAAAAAGGAAKKRKASVLRKKARPPAAPTRRSARNEGKAAPDYAVEKVLAGGKVIVGGGDTAALLAGIDSAKVAAEKKREERLAAEGPLTLESTGGTEHFGARFLASLRELAAEAEAGAGSAAEAEGVCDLAFAERMSKLSISPPGSDPEHTADRDIGLAKVVPERIYGLAFVPTASKLIVAAGGRDGALGLWDVDGEDESGDVVSLYEPHRSCLNEISFDPQDPSKLYTIAYDNTVRRMDVAKEQFVEVFRYAPRAGDADNVWTQYGTLSPSGSEFWLSTSDGHVACVDVRSGREVLRARLHEKKANTVSCCPAQGGGGGGGGMLFATSSLDRSVRLWDSRLLRKGKGGGGPSAVAKPLWECPCSRSINSAFFNARGDRLLSLGMANHISLFANPATKSGIVQADAKINHNNKTGRYLTVLWAKFDPKTPSAFVVGSMAQPRQVEVYSALLPGEAGCSKKGKPRMQRVMSLQDPAWMGSVQSRNAFHPVHDIVAAANASGKVHIFRNHAERD